MFSSVLIAAAKLSSLVFFCNSFFYSFVILFVVVVFSVYVIVTLPNLSNVLIGIYHLCGIVRLQIDMYLSEVNYERNCSEDKDPTSFDHLSS